MKRHDVVLLFSWVLFVLTIIGLIFSVGQWREPYEVDWGAPVSGVICFGLWWLLGYYSRGPHKEKDPLK